MKRCNFCEMKQDLFEDVLTKNNANDFKCIIKNPHKGIIQIISDKENLEFEIIMRAKYCPLCGKKLTV